MSIRCNVKKILQWCIKRTHACKSQFCCSLLDINKFKYNKFSSLSLLQKKKSPEMLPLFAYCPIFFCCSHMSVLHAYQCIKISMKSLYAKYWHRSRVVFVHIFFYCCERNKNRHWHAYFMQRYFQFQSSSIYSSLFFPGSQWTNKKVTHFQMWSQNFTIIR